MRTWMWSILLSLLVSAGSNTYAEDLYIGDFSASGRITWNDPYTTGFYRVEWASAITQEVWSTNWSGLSSIRGTGGAVTAAVPMFYRVVFTTDTFPWGITPLNVEDWNNHNADPSWSLSSNGIVRANNGISSYFGFKEKVPGNFVCRFDMQPLGTGGTDGKAFFINDANRSTRQIGIDDDWEYYISALQDNVFQGYVDYVDFPTIATNTVYSFTVTVTATNIMASINSVILDENWTSTPPYSIYFGAQRTGFRVTNFRVDPL